MIFTFTARRRPKIFPAAPATPQSKAVASRPITTGAATIVLKRPTPPTPVNALIKRRVVSEPFKIFETAVLFFPAAPVSPVRLRDAHESERSPKGGRTGLGARLGPTTVLDIERPKSASFR